MLHPGCFPGVATPPTASAQAASMTPAPPAPCAEAPLCRSAGVRIDRFFAAMIPTGRLDISALLDPTRSTAQDVTVHLGDRVGDGAPMARPGLQRLLDLDAVGAVSGDPVHQVTGFGPAELLPRLRNVHRIPRADRRVRNRHSDILLERRRRQAPDEDPVAPEAVKGHGSEEASGDHRGEPGEAPFTDVGGGDVPGAERIAVA